jgi:hypothetical protein
MLAYALERDDDMSVVCNSFFSVARRLRVCLPAPLRHQSLSYLFLSLSCNIRFCCIGVIM